MEKLVWWCRADPSLPFARMRSGRPTNSHGEWAIGTEEKPVLPLTNDDPPMKKNAVYYLFTSPRANALKMKNRTVSIGKEHVNEYTVFLDSEDALFYQKYGRLL